jgi:hypothetical protein
MLAVFAHRVTAVVCCAAVESCEAALPPLLCAEECVYSARGVLNLVATLHEVAT